MELKLVKGKDKSIETGIYSRLQAEGRLPEVQKREKISKGLTTATKAPSELTHTQKIVEDYRNAFERLYPEKVISIRTAGMNFMSGLAKFWVFIDGEKGERALTLEELEEATAEFNHGRKAV